MLIYRRYTTSPYEISEIKYYLYLILLNDKNILKNFV